MCAESNKIMERETFSELGVSVVICCHNSGARLPETLACLVRQEGHEGIPWEVIVVDNASTDDTAEVARACWPENPPAPLRVVIEPVPGLSNARIRGFDTARYAFVSFVDDDNRVARNWIAQVNTRMSSDPMIGACGGGITAEFEDPPPEWWPEFTGNFAVGLQWPEEGEVTHTKTWLYGAGLTVRKSAWAQLRSKGFRFYTTGRRGKGLTGGEDNELCYALRLAGWKLWLDWSLELRHLMPRGRVTWDYVRRLYRGAGATCLTLHGYSASRPKTLCDHLRMHWWWQVLATGKQLFLNPADLWAYVFSRTEGNFAVLRTEGRLARCMELFRLRGNYQKMFIAILTAEWRKLEVQQDGQVSLPRGHQAFRS